MQWFLANCKKADEVVDYTNEIVLGELRDTYPDLLSTEEFLSFLRGMFKGVEPTKYIQLAYLTGILPIKREKTGMSLFSLSIP